jgi:hypothetical protein
VEAIWSGEFDLKDNPTPFLIEMLKWFSHKFGAWPMLMNLISILCSFRYSHNMANEIIFGSSAGIWDSREIEKVMIGSGTYKDPSPILIYVTLGIETCIVVLIETIFEAFEECKLFIPTPVAIYVESIVGMDLYFGL